MWPIPRLGSATGKNVVTSKITVTATATKIPTTNQKDRKAIAIRNYSNVNTVFVGNSTVTTDGYPILPYESLPLDINQGLQIYGICETGKTVEVRTIEIDNY